MVQVRSSFRRSFKQNFPTHMSLENFAIIRDAVSQRSSSWDRTGGNFDCVTDLAPGKSAVLLNTEGPGKITHIWLTLMEFPGHEMLLRDLVFRLYWEGSAVPSRRFGTSPHDRRYGSDRIPYFLSAGLVPDAASCFVSGD